MRGGRGVRTIVTGPIVHLCPHVDEVDHGTVTLDFDGEASELHALRGRIEAFRNETITHEALTQVLADEFGATVTTQWRTASLDVTVVAEPGE